MNQTKSESPTVLTNDVLVPLESILCTDELSRRPQRPPDYEAENRGLMALTQALADSPNTILQTMAEKMVEIFQCGSAGFSLLTKDGKRFFWPAIAGAWQPQIGGGTPRDFGPCGDVLDRNAPLLFRHCERRYHYLMAATPPIEECLLVPFYVEGRAVGTIWAIAHDDRRKFDAEDLRQLESLGRFASAAYRTVDSLAAAGNQHRAALNLMEDAVRSKQLAESLVRELRSEVAERKRAEERLREEDRRKDEFLATLAHELRNPLAPIRNSLDMLRMAGTSGPAAERIRAMMERQVSQLVRLVDDLMEVSRISRGTFELRKERVEVAAIVRNAVETSTPAIEAAGHQLAITLPPDPLTLYCDTVRMTQAVANLLNNAAKYTKRAGQIWLTARREGMSVVLSVRDNGSGISTDMLPRVFQMFMQVEPGQGGLGIGLALVQNIVQLHGGTVTALSAGLGQGSEFILRLPLAAASLATVETEPAVSPRAAFSSRRILLVDDNRDVADSLAMLLKFLGADVHVVNDGPSALAKLSIFKPDVIFLDIGMPEMNGYELAGRIRQQSEFREVPLVALTGWGQEEDRRRTMKAGFQYHLVKPVALDTLRALLASLKGGPIAELMPPVVTNRT